MQYHDQELPEARFVRAVDKMLPGLTHLLNRGHAIRQQGVTREELEATLRPQLAEVAGYAGEFGGTVELLRALHVMILGSVE